jgi:acetyl esterase/lipase
MRRPLLQLLAAMAIAGAPLFSSPTLMAQSPSASTSPQPRLLRASDVDTLPVRDPGTRIRYGVDSLHFGDLRLPPGPGPFPLAIVIHGGCWYSPYASLRNTAPLAQALTEAGVATWNLEYRRYDNPGGGWPGTFRDIVDGAAHVGALADRYPIDLLRVVAVGHSAGGHLALWLATAGRLPEGHPLRGTRTPPTLRGVVSMGGITDLREYQARQLQTCGNPGVESLLGGLPDAVPDRLLDASPIERLPLGVPSIHVAGERDQIAPVAIRDAFATRARAAGDQAEVVTIPGEGHFEVIAPGRAAAAAVINAVMRLVAR